jgi:hypothetical protein
MDNASLRIGSAAAWFKAGEVLYHSCKMAFRHVDPGKDKGFAHTSFHT